MAGMKHLLFTVLLVAAPATAYAGGSAGSIGVGVEVSLTGSSDVSVNYDAGPFHVGGAFGYSDNRPGTGPSDNDVRISGRFYYHLHSTALADFGIGGEVTIEDQSGDNNTALDIAGGFQIRSFISTNVALSFTGGFVVGLVDDDGFALDGTPVGVAGVHYYFF
jgi:hypothetical protein